MATTGPELPPHLLAKRKRTGEEAGASPQQIIGAKSPTPDSATKRPRVVGPSMPPAPLDELPPTTASSEDTSSEDELGPALPPARHGQASEKGDTETSTFDKPNRWDEEKSAKPQREEWMLVPPKQEDWSSKVDPTKLRNRKFNTGKGAKAPAPRTDGENTVWTETPEQKRQRLEDEVMGVKQPATQNQASSGPDRRARKDDDTAKRIQEYNDEHRNSSLYQSHKHSGPRDKEEDDPSKRAFDREKDIGGGRKIGHAQRKELLNRAADFGSKFARGNYL